MKDLLFINLKRPGDIYQMAWTLAAIKAKAPQSKIHVLVYKEFQVAAKSLTMVDTVHTIDRKRSIVLRNGPVFSDGLALESVLKDIGPLRQIKWEMVVNYSNDMVSTHLASFLTYRLRSDVHRGIKYSKHQTVTYSNDWAVVFNDILTAGPASPMNFADCQSRTVAQTNAPRETGRLIKCNARNDEMARKNFQALRDSAGTNGPAVRIVGIQLRSSTTAKDIGVDVIVELVRKLVGTPELFPVLLIAPNDTERSLANEVNSYFGNKLISVEADLIALPSVLKNIELLVTPDTCVMHVADLCGTPIVEVSKGPSPFFKQGPLGEKNLVISAMPTERSWAADTSTDEWPIDATSIYAAIQYRLSMITAQDVELAEGLCLYETALDTMGANYVHVAGEVDEFFDLSRTAARQFIHAYLDKGWENLFKSCRNVSPRCVSRWLNEQKDSLTYLTKTLLGSIRSLLKAEENIKHGQEFAVALDRLLRNCESNNIAAVPTQFFRARLESLSSGSVTDNFKEVERLLYHLKNDVQIAVKCLSLAEEHFFGRTKETEKAATKTTTEVSS